MVGFFIGIFLGGAAGFLTAAVLSQASLNDDAMEWELHELEDARTFFTGDWHE